LARTALETCSAKLDRADEVLATLEKEWRDFVNTNPYSAEVHEQPDTGWVNVYIDFSAEAPVRLSILAGEVAHEVRSTLEHMVWALAVKHLEREPTEKEAREITFPVAPNREAFDSAHTRRYLGEDAWAVLEDAQPYKGPHGPDAHPLGFLHWFNRIDKHRTVHASATFPEPYAIERIVHWNPEAGLIEKMPFLIPRTRPEGKTEVMRLRFAPWDPFTAPQPDVSVKGELPLEILFGDFDPEGVSAGTLAHIVSWARLPTSQLAQLLA
jgi:hypothetical protein